MVRLMPRQVVALAIGATALCAAAAAPTLAQEQSSNPAFNPTQEEAIETIIKDYLLEHPEVLVEALQTYQERQRVAATERQKEQITAQKDLLENDADAPVLGNPQGDVVVVEFFDYRCPYCQKVAQDVRDIVTEDGNVRLVMKELPILSAQSRYAAKAALASVNQEKYEDFHFALMQITGNFDQLAVLRVAEAVGLDTEKLQKDMRDPEIDAALRRTYDLAQTLEINGTPAFVVGDQLVPGALSAENLRQLIAEARSKSS